MTEGMEVGMCSCDYDGEAPEFYRIDIVKARKEHRCCECSDMIKPGDVYERISGKWDGEVYTCKTCVVCSRIRLDFCAPLTMLRETIWEAMQVDYVGEWEEEDD